VNSTYWDILAAVQASLRMVSGLTGSQVKIRPKPMVSKDAGDTLPLVIVCPRRDSWEEVVELQFDNNCHIDYPVLVAVVIDNAFDQASLRWQMGVRQAVRRRLFRPDAVQAAVPSTFDVRYSPNPRGADSSALSPNLDASFQEFTFRASEQRAEEP
jgi:hypothetical protein